MRRKALSVVTGAALMAALTLFPAPASAAGREPGRLEVRGFAVWLAGAWARAVEAISLTIDPDGSAVQSTGEPEPPAAGDISWMIDPDGSTVQSTGEPEPPAAGDISLMIDPNG
jgi:hypothetical protein